MQVDGNFGLLAAVNEMFVQSHHPGWIHLLPATPAEILFAGGYIQGLKLRGDLLFDMRWEPGGRFAFFRLTIQRPHPWLGCIQEHENDPGYYHLVCDEVVQGRYVQLSVVTRAEDHLVLTSSHVDSDRSHRDADIRCVPRIRYTQETVQPSQGSKHLNSSYSTGVRKPWLKEGEYRIIHIEVDQTHCYPLTLSFSLAG